MGEQAQSACFSPDGEVRVVARYIYNLQSTYLLSTYLRIYYLHIYYLHIYYLLSTIYIQVIVVGTVTGKWVVLSSSTREVFSVNQESGGGEPVHIYISTYLHYLHIYVSTYLCNYLSTIYNMSRSTPASSVRMAASWRSAAETTPSTFTRYNSLL